MRLGYQIFTVTNGTCNSELWRCRSKRKAQRELSRRLLALRHNGIYPSHPLSYLWQWDTPAGGWNDLILEQARF